MADVVEKKLDMSLDQIADERKQELRNQSQNHQSSSSAVGNSSDGGFRPRDASASPRNGDHFGGKARTSRRSDRSAPYQSRPPRFSNHQGNRRHDDDSDALDNGGVDRRVYVGNLSWNVTSDMLRDFMEQAHDVAEVDMFETRGRPKGCAIVTFKSSYGASKAIETLNDSELDGRKVFVRKDREQRHQPPPRPGSGCRVYVGNLSWNVKWQDLKDHMKKAGMVVHADVLEEPNGRSKGCGLVEYSTPREARNAIHELTNSELEGRLIFVREDREPEGGSISMIKNRVLGRGGGNGDMMVPQHSNNMPYYSPAPMQHNHQYQQPYPPIHMQQQHHQFQRPMVPQYHHAVGGNEGRQIYVGNLPWDTHWESLRDLFRTVGEVERAEIPQYPDGRSRGFGIVRFFNAESAWQAIMRYDQAEVNGRVIEVRMDQRGQ